MPYRARLDERTPLNLPGFQASSYVLTYVEDTSERGLFTEPGCGDDCPSCPHNFEPRMELEIVDCNRMVRLWFDLDTEAGRVNSLHKLDTLAAALNVFRVAFLEELEPYDRRERELEELRS